MEQTGSRIGALRLLLVDDDESVLKVLEARLAHRGFEVTCAGSVAAAICDVSNKQFDVLVTDLNIGQPGDGFTVVSAMRRTQPQAITIILTGYPDFETALNAIKNQVDDYLIKPPDIDKLVRRIEDLRNRKADAPRTVSRPIADIIEQNAETIVERWLTAEAQLPEFAHLSLTAQERRDTARKMLVQLTRCLKGCSPENGPALLTRDHGRLLREQGYSLMMILEENHLAQRCIFLSVQSNLLSADLSTLVMDMIRVSDILQEGLRATVEGYVTYSQTPQSMA